MVPAMRARTFSASLGLVVVFACIAACTATEESKPAPKPTPVPGTACTEGALAEGENFFTYVTDRAGLTATPAVTAPPAGFPRMGLYDVNGDGFDDIVSNSWFPDLKVGQPYVHRVFINDGKGKFTDKAVEMGLANVQAAVLSFADLDNDGDPDCFAGLDVDPTEAKYADIPELKGATSIILMNDGTGRFTKKENSGVEGATLADAVSFGDYNNDGIVDIFVGRGHTAYASKDSLFFGKGDGTFTDESAKLVRGLAQPSNGSVACDYDNDGDLDIFVSTYGVSVRKGWNHLWENDGTGNFTEVAEARGFNALATGTYWNARTGRGRDSQEADASKWIGSNGFGIDCADVTGDGNLDIWLATISHGDGADFNRLWSDPSQLLVNNPDGFRFGNEFLDRGLSYNEGDIDAAVGDYDNDGLLDLFITRTAKYEGNYSGIEQKGYTGLFRQRPDGSFESKLVTSGLNDTNGATSRGKEAGNIALFDMDGDGDLDVMVAHTEGAQKQGSVIENTLGSKNAWLALRVKGDGKKVHRDAFGTRVTLKVGGKVYLREKKSSHGTYSSGESATLNFGLGGASACVDGKNVATMDVRWPDGTVDSFDASQFSLRKRYLLNYGTKKLETLP
jgi:hypothetical protein